MPLTGMLVYAKRNFPDILNHSFPIAVLSEPIFQCEVAYGLLSKMPHIALSQFSRRLSIY